MYGGENAVAFKYRVHDARIGRFLSLDPLAPEYPHNSPYAFSENRVIDAVELEGRERLSVHIMSEPSGGEPGRAMIRISTAAYIVRSGDGAVDADLSSAQFSRIYDRGDEITLQLSNLPTQGERARSATPEEIDAGTYYEVQIDYRYDLIDVGDMTLERARREMRLADDHRNHIVRLPVANLSSTDNEAINRFNRDDAQLAGAVTDTYSGEEVLLNPVIFGRGGRNVNLTREEIIAHELGHASAQSLTHDNYPQDAPGTSLGLLSGTRRQVRPNERNTMDIINDGRNRSTITTTSEEDDEP